MNNIKKLLIITTVFAVMGFSGYSQNSEEMGYIKGEVMVQLKNEHSINKVLNDYACIDKTSIQK
mgnify:CR=1 FL=1